MTENLFRQAKQLWDSKNSWDMTKEERHLVAAAMIPLTVHGCPLPEDITISEGLEELAKILDGN
ncbi:hypothetical protein KKH23_09635 [Patescibacteria group bacterium]|nr:hypothetical protein [Patescibacteria group bacterium]